MKPDYNLCDICGSKVNGPSIFLATDRVMDAAGSMEKVGETYDLCHKCLCNVINHLVKHKHDLGQQVVEFVHKLKSVARAK